MFQIQEFPWSPSLQGIVLGSFFYGYILSQIPGGWLAARHGGKRVFGIGIAVTSLITLITPLLARLSIYLLVLGRVIEGIFEVNKFVYKSKIKFTNIYILNRKLFLGSKLSLNPCLVVSLGTSLREK